jgi:peptide/nickel transport system substrate-binding protein
MQQTRTVSRLCVALVILTSLVGLRCGSQPPASHRLNRVRVLMTNEPKSLSLIGKTDRNAEIVAAQIADGLLQYDADLSLQPALADSWEFSADQLTLTFHLRTDVRWHDGTPFQAEDVVSTVNLIRDPATENRSFGPKLDHMVSISAIDEHTVTVVYDQASPDVLHAWWFPIIPGHLMEPGVGILEGTYKDHPVGTGPFRFLHYKPGVEIALEANDDYWGGRPTIDQLVFKFYPEQRTAYQELLAGNLDLAPVTYDLYEEARNSPDADHLASIMYSRFSVWQLALNQDGSNPFFGDPRVRIALVTALDRESFIENVLFDAARPGITSYHPDTIWADQTIAPWPYDQAAAKQLLDDAGWRDTDGDGIRDKNGQPFSFTLMISASTQKIVDYMAAWEQESWRALGLDVEIEKLEWLAFREKRNAHQFDALSAGFTFGPEPDQTELYHSSARENGFNFFGLADPEIDRLLDAGTSTFGDAARIDIYHRLQRRLHETEPLTCLFYFSTPVLFDRDLIGVTPSPRDIYRISAGPRLWHWAEADQGM